MVRVFCRSDSLRRCSSTCAFSSCSTADATVASTASARFSARRASSFACGELALELTTRAPSRREPRSLFASSSRDSSSVKPPLVVAVNSLRHVLERAHGFLARLPLEKSEIRELEQRDRGQKALRGSRAEHLALLVQHEQRAQLAFGSEPAHVQPSLFAERRQLKQARELVAVSPKSTNWPPAAIACRSRVGRWSNVVSSVARGTADGRIARGACRAARRTSRAPAARNGRPQPRPRPALGARRRGWLKQSARERERRACAAASLGQKRARRCGAPRAVWGRNVSA